MLLMFFIWLRQVLNSELLSKTTLIIHMFRETFQTIHVSEIVAIVFRSRKFLQKTRHPILTAAISDGESVNRTLKII